MSAGLVILAIQSEGMARSRPLAGRVFVLLMFRLVFIFPDAR